MGFIANVRAKIPRIAKGPCCWTLEEFALRMAMSQFSVGAMAAGVLFYLSTEIEDSDTHDTSVGILISVGVVFCFPAVFAVLLFIGVLRDNLTLLKTWLIYSTIETIVFALFFGIITIFSFTISIGSGFLFIFLTLLLVFHFLHTIAVVHTIYLKIEEKGSEQQPA